MAKAGFRHIPQQINATRAAPTAADAERGLRDAGFSRRQAKAILVKGLRGGLRDAGPTGALRDAAPQTPAKKDRVAELLRRAEIAAAPNQTDDKEK
jgi:hypothetical protein